MANFPSYPTRSFSETQKFFVLDPQTGTPSFVLGSDLVSYITPSLAVVQAELTTDTAKAENFSVGVVIQTTGGTAVGDGDPGLFLVVGSGDGDIPMDNGNELLILAGANAAMGISYDNSSSGLQSANVQAAIDELTGTSEIINISVAGSSDYTLSAADLVYSGFNLTGTLTGDIDVIVPDTPRRYTFVNSTSGSFTITVKTSGGTGVLLPQGELRQVRCDGTNVITGDGFSDFTSMPEVNGASIVESGTNANGEWTVFSDGRQIAVTKVTIDMTLTSAQGFAPCVPFTTVFGNSWSVDYDEITTGGRRASFSSCFCRTRRGDTNSIVLTLDVTDTGTALVYVTSYGVV